MSEIKPIRIQRKRVKGFSLQNESMARNSLSCVYVGRPTIFGNPFSLKEFTRDEAFEKYKEMLSLKIPISDEQFDYYRSYGVAAGLLIFQTTEQFF